MAVRYPDANFGSMLFDQKAQRHFADLSGDHNPMHMDALWARRTQAGAPVVHGVHSMLKALDLFAASNPALPPIASLKANFNKLTYVGDTVDYRLTQMTDEAAVIDALVDGAEVLRLSLSFGTEVSAAAVLAADGADAQRPTKSIDLTMEQMRGLGGRVGAAAGLDEIAAAFPFAARLWGAQRVRAALCTTVLVGMVCPGLHSIYSQLVLNSCEVAKEDCLSYQVSQVSPRFRVVRMQVRGSGIAGSIDSFVRMPPTPQLAMAQVSDLVQRDEFAGSTAFVVGGSRGLGELTAKFLAAGGANVIISYATGEADAQLCAQAIRDHGGSCQVMRYDARQPATAQLTPLQSAPSHLYYFATPTIARRKSELFVASRYAELQTFYVSGFYDLFQALLARAPNGLAAFYPSTIFVETRPADMTEYAMAKSAGETLAMDMDAHLPNARIIVSRLPRLLTDQTATVVQSEMADPVAVMLPIIRGVQGNFVPAA